MTDRFTGTSNAAWPGQRDEANKVRRIDIMKIGIIGAGNVGGTLGKAWGKKGHELFYGVRRPQDRETRELVRATGPAARAASPAEAAAFGAVVLLAVPWRAAEDAVRSAGDLTGKVLIDCTNPLKPDLSGLEIGHTTSGAEKVAAWANGARVFKAFNTTGFNIMADPIRRGPWVGMPTPSSRACVIFF
jgi:predicted dinucleotide-binding enzyme